MTPARRSRGAPSSRLWALAFGVAVLAQLVVLYLPRTPSVSAPAMTDKVVHVLLFAGPVAVGLRAGLPAKWLAVAFLVHAPVSELVQYAVLPQRSGDPWDAVDDVLGVFVALVGWGLRPGGRYRRTARLAIPHQPR
ncbi:MAG: VanZ family protein [Dermatophilaceae bacterium]